MIFRGQKREKFRILSSKKEGVGGLSPGKDDEVGEILSDKEGIDLLPGKNDEEALRKATVSLPRVCMARAMGCFLCDLSNRGDAGRDMFFHEHGSAFPDGRAYPDFVHKTLHDSETESGAFVGVPGCEHGLHGLFDAFDARSSVPHHNLDTGYR